MESTNKRYLLAIDVSGSMSWGGCAGASSITPRVASAAMAMVTARTEPNYYFVGFSHNLVPLNLGDEMQLDEVIETIEQASSLALYIRLRNYTYQVSCIRFASHLKTPIPH